MQGLVQLAKYTALMQFSSWTVHAHHTHRHPSPKIEIVVKYYDSVFTWHFIYEKNYIYMTSMECKICLISPMYLSHVECHSALTSLGIDKLYCNKVSSFRISSEITVSSQISNCLTAINLKNKSIYIDAWLIIIAVLIINHIAMNFCILCVNILDLHLF